MEVTVKMTQHAYDNVWQKLKDLITEDEAKLKSINEAMIAEKADKTNDGLHETQLSDLHKDHMITTAEIDLLYDLKKVVELSALPSGIFEEE